MEHTEKKTDDVRKVALVTGAGVRVGRAIACALAADGYDVVLHYGHSETAAKEVCDRIHALGARGTLIQSDLSQPRAAEHIVSHATARFGRLDLVVNNAAMFERRAFRDIDVQAFDEMLNVNLKAPFFICQMAAPFLAEAEGLIVNILDVAAFNAWPGYAHYGVAKAGLAMLTRILAQELAPHVRVCGIAPGTVAFPDDYPEADRQRVLSRIPMGRQGHPDDIAETVRFLCRANYITGAVIPVDGGRMAGPGGIL